MNWRNTILLACALVVLRFQFQGALQVTGGASMDWSALEHGAQQVASFEKRLERVEEELAAIRLSIKSAPQISSATPSQSIRKAQGMEKTPAITLRIEPDDQFSVSAHTDKYYGETFSACLIWMDDKRKLGEWLAYHYQVLPLRNLVFFRDPKSLLDPLPILDRWRPYLNITYWTHPLDFMENETYTHIQTSFDRQKRFRHGQKMFVRGCLAHLKEQNRTWTIHIDTDEFLALESRRIPDARTKMKQHGIAMDVIKKARQKDPSVGVRNETDAKWFSDCIGVIRYEFSSYESEKELVQKDVPPFVDPYRFSTLRFRHPGKKGITGKSMLDVSKFEIESDGVNTYKRYNVHGLLENQGCNGKWGNRYDLLYVGHYLGSYEGFVRNADNRFENMTEKWDTRQELHVGKLLVGKGDDMRPWMEAFVDYVGEEQSKLLLEGVGFPYNETTAMEIRP